MASRESAFVEITPEVLLKAYACGIFPMAESAEDPSLHWIEPDLRGVIPLDRFRVTSRLARTVRSDQFTVTVNRDFDGVIDGCAEPQPGRPRTWINERIRSLYRKLYERRHCHSMEVYVGDDLVGGLYGVARPRLFGKTFPPPATRQGAWCMMARLRPRLVLLDTQFVTDHPKSFGAIEVPRRQYRLLNGVARRRRLHRPRQERRVRRAGWRSSRPLSERRIVCCGGGSCAGRLAAAGSASASAALCCGVRLRARRLLQRGPIGGHNLGPRGSRSARDRKLDARPHAGRDWTQTSSR
jgi:leucyl/phenylalanyl-tRNA--protein transferase